MQGSITSPPGQLHPLQVALKDSWQRLVVIHHIKQDWLAMRVGKDKGTISRWLNPENKEDFPSTKSMALMVEAMQDWPGVERWEPLEAFNLYFGCHVAEMHPGAQPLRDLAGLLAIQSGKALQLILQALSPDSDGGVEVTEEECEELLPTITALRRIADDLDDAISGTTPGIRKVGA